ncbi:hypothetical protein NLN92_21340 [Citrobacter portucalensis]|uniref:hypothetical protein n=1 Tax=Citrobacter portucalensis TaxID=1639133 RepID=UPI00226B5291|nr:hypothetical protein [Citrobacter portucalensis]MCX8980550.1 hypothetical protein [Citrobacter portucalensis]
MNVTHGQFNAQGTTLPQGHQNYVYGMTDEANQNLQRAIAACDFLQLLLSQYPTRDSLPLAENMPGMAALMDYMREDLIRASKGIGLIAEEY